MPVGVYGRIKGKKYGMSGKKHTVESISKMRESHKGIIHTVEHKKKISERLKGRISPFKGRHHTQESKNKQSISINNVYRNNPELRIRQSKSHLGKNTWMKGTHPTEETRQKLRDNHPRYWLGKKRSKEDIEKFRLYQINHPNKITKNTSIEIKIENELKNRNIKYKKHFPIKNIAIVDFYLKDKNIVIQCDGCYWHSCKIHCPTSIKSKEKDIRQNKLLKDAGYIVFRFWEHEINNSAEECINKIFKGFKKEIKS